MNQTILKQALTFSFDAPAAQTVLLAGDFTHWQKKPIPLTKQLGGLWKTTTSLAPAHIITVFWWMANGATTRIPHCVSLIRLGRRTQCGWSKTAPPNRASDAPRRMGIAGGRCRWPPARRVRERQSPPLSHQSRQRMCITYQWTWRRTPVPSSNFAATTSLGE